MLLLLAPRLMYTVGGACGKIMPPPLAAGGGEAKPDVSPPDVTLAPLPLWLCEGLSGGDPALGLAREPPTLLLTLLLL